MELVEEVVGVPDLAEAVRVVHPALRRREMQLGPVGLGCHTRADGGRIEHCDTVRREVEESDAVSDHGRGIEEIGAGHLQCRGIPVDQDRLRIQVGVLHELRRRSGVIDPKRGPVPGPDHQRRPGGVAMGA
jgi:hypothetical protein